nr:hypothetical protein [uncultured Carboxylicivirga sp.]
MIASLLLGDKKNLLIGGAVIIGLIALASSGSSAPKPALNGVCKSKAPKKPSKPAAKKTISKGRKTAKIKI